MNEFINLPIFVSESGLNAFMWYFFIVILIIGGIIFGVILISLSQKPKEWKHISFTEDIIDTGRLENLASNIKYSSTDLSEYSPIRNHLQMLFFEKLREIYGLSPEEIIQMKENNKKMLRSLINDKEIEDWILKVNKPEKKGFFDFLKTNSQENRIKYLNEVEKIIEKMEVWGE